MSSRQHNILYIRFIQYRSAGVDCSSAVVRKPCRMVRFGSHFELLQSGGSVQSRMQRSAPNEKKSIG